MLKKKNKLSANERLEICKKCPIYSIKFGGTCNSKLWLNPDTNQINFKPKAGFIQGCGCLLSNKIQAEGESCPAGKW